MINNNGIEYLVYTNIFGLCLYFLSLSIKGIWKLIGKNKDDVITIKAQMDVYSKHIERVPKLREDIDSAHNKIRKLEQAILD